MDNNTKDVIVLGLIWGMTGTASILINNVTPLVFGFFGAVLYMWFNA